MKTNYKHISRRERKQIQELMQAGKTNKEIAKELGRARAGAELGVWNAIVQARPGTGIGR